MPVASLLEARARHALSPSDRPSIPIFAKQGPKAFEDWLNTVGVENINNVNNALKGAHSWHEKVQTH